MIKKVKYQEIDFEKYTDALKYACQNTDFAVREFLDVVTNKQWDLLVLNDYEAVMPVHWSLNFGIKVVQTPKLCPQLGIFSKIDSLEINTLFYEFLLNNYAVSTYAFNPENQLVELENSKKSYFIPLSNYEFAKKNYSVHRRRNVRITEKVKDALVITKNEFDDHILSFFCENVKGISSKKEIGVYWNIVKELYDQKLANLYTLYYDGELQSLAFCYIGKKTNYLSIFVNCNQLHNANIPSFMIDKILQDTIEDYHFDFLGSMIPNVAQFNERFGSDIYEYMFLSFTKVKVVTKMLQNNPKKYIN